MNIQTFVDSNKIPTRLIAQSVGLSHSYTRKLITGQRKNAHQLRKVRAAAIRIHYAMIDDAN